MARPTRDEIETYMSITGASESLALQKFEEHGGNLNEAVNAHFGGAEIHVAHPPPAPIPQHSFTNNNESQFGRGLFPILSAARSFRPSLLLDPNYRRDLFNRIGAAAITGPASLHSPPGAVMGLPVEPNSRHEQLHHSTASSSSGLSERTLQEDDDFARAVLLSLKTAEQEKVAREQHMEGEIQEFGNNRRSKQGSSLNSNGAHNVIEEQQLRQNPIHSAGNHHQHGEEWGGISSKELDEALMLETALFSEISEGTSNRSLIATQLQSGLEKRTIPDLQPTPHPSLQPLPASRLLKEQQDMEYLASLFHDKEKEEESHKKMLNELECERRLAAKKASLAWEPASDDENAVTLLVRMPNGSRLGRRFLKSDKLKLLFDFIDINGAVEPGSYRVVRSYPRRAFTVDDGLLTLSKLDLTNKQEALFLELI
ncbi:plant UBX domain-containing protein 9 isoform X2 [Morus notabilis]|uniref:plant UBX domain-containing protein 9 isoform X2 n=1 Tax=Morus notabilis TaxID=981085 RepID=UPI000CED6CC6|nr:plant UBX domain-containing protein 9 isoform X2 [Morus notabilis]